MCRCTHCSTQSDSPLRKVLGSQMNIDTILNEALSAFISLLIAFNVIAVLPVFISVTADMDHDGRNRLISQATLTALIVSLLFIALGKLIFEFLGITSSDFRVGGGIVLLVLSVSDLL